MRQLFLMLVCGTLALTGCGKASSVKTYPVKGTVIYDGKPVEGASVVYLPANPDSPRVSGTTDADGKFSLTTFVSASEILAGAPADEYKVLITKTKGVEGVEAASSPDFQNLSMEEKQKSMGQMMQKMTGAPASTGKGGPTEKAVAPRPTNLLPEKYGNAKTTPLSAVVVVGNNEPSEFKLTDD